MFGGRIHGPSPTSNFGRDRPQEVSAHGYFILQINSTTGIIVETTRLGDFTVRSHEPNDVVDLWASARRPIKRTVKLKWKFQNNNLKTLIIWLYTLSQVTTC